MDAGHRSLFQHSWYNLHSPYLRSRVLPFRSSTPRRTTYKVWWGTRYRISQDLDFDFVFACFGIGEDGVDTKRETLPVIEDSNDVERLVSV